MRYYRTALCVLLLVTISGCADSVTFAEAASREPVGFWEGVLHGFILPFSLIVSLFSDSTAIYATYNNGTWYDVGFVIGVAILHPSSKSAFSAKQDRAAGDAEFQAELKEIRAELAKRTEHPPREWKPSSEEPPTEDTQDSEPEQAGS